MNDRDKTKEQLISELVEMRQQVAVLEAPGAEHKQDETIPSLAEEEYQRLFEISPIGVTIVDMKGTILYCNSVVYDKGGYPKGEFTGKHFSKTSSVRVKDIPTYIRTFNSIVRGKIPKPFEAIYQRKDGTTGWIELHIAMTRIGGKQRILVMQHDITGRKQMGEALRQSENNMKVYLESTPDGIYLNDLKGTFLYGNKKAEEIIGYKREELVGNSFLKLAILPKKYLAFTL